MSAAIGVWWFREGGGTPTATQAPVSGRDLSFAEREEVAILRAQEPPACTGRPSSRRLRSGFEWRPSVCPGRKTEVMHSEWICRLAQHGLVRPSFVPPRDPSTV